MTDFTITGKRLNNEYIRSEARKQAKWALVFCTFVVSLIVLGAAGSQMPQAFETLTQVPQ